MVSLGRRRSGCRGLVGKCEKRDHLKELNLDGRITKWIFRKEKGGRSGFFWLRLGRIGGLLRTRRWTFGFHEMQGIS